MLYFDFAIAMNLLISKFLKILTAVLIEVLSLSPGLQIILWSRQGKNFYLTRRTKYIISGCLGFWVFLSVAETITGLHLFCVVGIV